MPWFEGTYSDTRTLPVAPEVAKAHFADLATIIATTKGVEASEVADRTIHFVMAEEDHGVVKFKADFRCTYELDGDTLRWSTSDGNLQQSGEATFEGADDGCTLNYRETVKVELGVPAMMAPMLQPVIGAMLASEIKDYVKRMSKAL